MTKRKKSFPIIFFVLFNFFHVAYAKDSTEKNKEIFYDNSATQIYQFNLSNLSRRLVYQNDSSAFSSAYIGVIDDSALLVTDLFNDKSYGSSIEYIDFKNGVRKHLIDGELAAYFSDSHKIFYVDGQYVFSADFLDGQIKNKKIISLRGPVPPVVVKISDNQYVLNDVNKSDKVFLYNTVTLEKKYLSIRDCDRPLFYRPNMRELVCSKADSNNKDVIFSTTLDGNKEHHFDQLYDYTLDFIAYYPQKDTMVFSMLIGRFFGGEEIQYFSYSFKSSKLDILRFT